MTNENKISLPVAKLSILKVFDNLPPIYHMKRYSELPISIPKINIYGHDFTFEAECDIHLSGGYQLVSAATHDLPEAVDDKHVIEDLKWSYMCLYPKGKDNILPDNIHTKFTVDEYRIIEKAVFENLIIEE